ncbi:hypothetical protein BS78_03G302400 [Paspalum vaginatum]|nr:hypothetical protein BS78_03G302400 [Paspalum vaginatum]
MKPDELICLHYRDYEHWKYEKFVRYVNNLLLLHDRVDLHTFQLHFDSHHLANCNDVRTWIVYAVKNNVKVLDVNLHRYIKTVLPRCIFTSRSVQESTLKMRKAPYKDYEDEGLVLQSSFLPSKALGLEDLHLTNCAQHLELVDSKVLKRLMLMVS